MRFSFGIDTARSTMLVPPLIAPLTSTPPFAVELSTNSMQFVTDEGLILRRPATEEEPLTRMLTPSAWFGSSDKVPPAEIVTPLST